LLRWALPDPALAHAQPTTTVQFDREIVHILDNHCVMCHAEGAVAFPLVTYEQTYAARWKIRQDALDRHMAPWAAVPGYGEFANDNGLTQREIDFLVSWAESYGPRNNGQVDTGLIPSKAASHVVQAHFDAGRWALGSPDLLLTVSASTAVPRQLAVPQHPAVSRDPSLSREPAVIHTTLDLKLTADRWLRGMEYKPGDRRVVHAVSFSIQETGQWLGSWTPWHSFVSLPEGLACKLPAGSHISVEIHYQGVGATSVNQGSLGLYFASEASQRTLTSVELEALPTQSTTPAASRKLLASRTLEQDLNILSLQPQLLPGLQSIEVSARKPDGATQILLFARDIPPDWPTPYEFRRAVSLVKGTQLSVVEHFADAAAVPASGIPVTLSAYQGTALATDQPQAPRQTSPSTRHFKLTGTVKSVDAEAGRVLIQHGDIPGFMGAMTMFYSVGKGEDLRKLASGDEVQSDVITSAAGTYLQNIKVIGKAH